MSKGTKSLQWPCLVVHHAQAFCKPLDTLKLKILCNREKLPKCGSKKTYYILQMHIWSRTSTCHELQWTSLLAIIGIIMTNAWSFPLWKSNTFRLLGLWWELKSRLSRNVFSKNVRNHFSMQRGWDETKHPFLWCVTQESFNNRHQATRRSDFIAGQKQLLLQTCHIIWSWAS